LQVCYLIFIQHLPWPFVGISLTTSFSIRIIPRKISQVFAAFGTGYLLKFSNAIKIRHVRLAACAVPATFGAIHRFFIKSSLIVDSVLRFHFFLDEICKILASIGDHHVFVKTQSDR
jgi:hypothetical protein